MTVEKLRKAAEELIARDKDMPIKYREYAAAVSAFDEAVSALTPERVLALCEAAMMVHTFCNRAGDPVAAAKRAHEVNAAIEAAFGEGDDARTATK